MNSKDLIEFSNLSSSIKTCSNCGNKRKKEEFCRLYKGNPQYEHATCNPCHLRHKNARKRVDQLTRKKTKLEASLNMPMPSVNTTVTQTINNSSRSLSDLVGLELDDDIPQELSSESLEKVNENDNINGLLYTLDEVQELVAKQFRDLEDSDEPVKLIFEIELDSRLVENIFLNRESQFDAQDLKAIRESFHQLANVLLLLFEYGSGYYWEVRKIYLNTSKKELAGCATVYLGCTQREDRQWQRPENTPVKRKSEIRPQINRYACMGNMIFTIDPQKQRAIVQCSHQLAHEHPQYRQVEFPAAAKEWIRDNIKYNLQSSKLYELLQQHKLINVNIHTKEQVYYWVTIFSRQTYMFDSTDQLLSAKKYLEQQQGFKITYYVKNSFVKAIGFTTPLLERIGIKNLKEIIIDSTFKTNQERFELFVVNANHRGYGMPLAYLFLLMCDGTEESYNNPKNTTCTRVQALREFFSSLRNEGLLPAFVLLDKDAGEISAVEEAWSWTANIQLCYWHLDHAIRRRLKDKKPKASGYSKEKAAEASHQFDFIDPSWFPENKIGSLCSDDQIKKIVSISMLPG
ncbi:23481_t:CDS:2 [Dentiscutata erythropus]|uniref:23481_t:CDS:1 n=1 Tax=Dentiscutata erythropus TaxID=1348616 RepID=A0A9N9FJT4_9GLOM|nr:23481_t:CDS:2 [Dentiscutata erythropus]